MVAGRGQTGSGTLWAVEAVEATEAKRRWWAIGPDPELPSITAKRAYVEVLFVYASFFAVGIIAAALLLAGRAKDFPTTGSWGVYLTNAVSVLSEIGVAVVVVLLLSARRGVSAGALGLKVPRRPDGQLAVSQTIRVAAWCFFAIGVGAAINALTQSGHLPTNQVNAPEQIFGAMDALQAGVIEEMVVLAFLVVTLRQAGRPWWEVTTVALILRGAYHIYYGPGVSGILVWAALYYWIYLRFRSVGPLIVCHALFDMIGFLSQSSIVVGAVGELLVVGVWITAVILWLVERSNRQPVAPAGPGPYYGGPGWPGSYHGGSGGPGWAGPSAGAPSPGWPGASGGDPGGPGWPGGPAWPGAPAPVPEPAPAYSAPAPAPAYPAQPVPPVQPVGPALPPAGWHPDPAGFNRWRWWDGQQWTEHVSQHPI